MRSFIRILAILLLLVGLFMIYDSIMYLTYSEQISKEIYDTISQQNYEFEKEAIRKGINKNQVIELVAGMYLCICALFSFKLNKKSWYALLSISFAGFLYGIVTFLNIMFSQQGISFFRLFITLISIALYLFIMRKKEKVFFT